MTFCGPTCCFDNDHVVSTMLGEQGFGRARSVMELANSSEQLVSKPVSSHYMLVGGGLLPMADVGGAIFLLNLHRESLNTL